MTLGFVDIMCSLSIGGIGGFAAGGIIGSIAGIAIMLLLMNTINNQGGTKNGKET